MNKAAIGLVFLVLVLVSPAIVGSATNLQLRVIDKPGSPGGARGFYTEVIKQGTNLISSYTVTSNDTEIAFWFDGNRVFSMTDTNRDGRFERFMISTNLIPEQIWVRNAENKLDPINGTELKGIQEKARAFTEGFGAMVDIVRETNEQEKATLRSVFSNLSERANQEGSQPRL